jgi:hypothetical protein
MSGGERRGSLGRSLEGVGRIAEDILEHLSVHSDHG